MRVRLRGTLAASSWSSRWPLHVSCVRRSAPRGRSARPGRARARGKRMIRVFTQDSWQHGTVDVYVVNDDRPRKLLLPEQRDERDFPSNDLVGWWEREPSENAGFDAVSL